MNSDQQLIIEAVHDYFEGWFDGDAGRMDRALHPGLAKRSLGQGDTSSRDLHSVTKDQMIVWTATGEGKSDARGGDKTIDVRIVEIYGNIASVVVRSAVYREYLHLVRTDGEWRIVNALWLTSQRSRTHAMLASLSSASSQPPAIAHEIPPGERAYLVARIETRHGLRAIGGPPI